MGSHSLLQGIFPTQGWDPSLLYCSRIVYRLSYQGSPFVKNILTELPDWWKVILWPISLLYQDDAFYLIWVRCTIWGCACKSCMRLIRKTNRKTKQNLQSLWIPRKITQELDLKHYKYSKLIDLVSITICHVLYDYKWICNSENLCSSQWWYHISFHLSVDKRAFSISQCRFWYTKQSAE